MKILVINCGSSSVKFKVFEMPEEFLVAEGNVEKIGEEIGLFSYTKENKQLFYRKQVDVKTHNEALSLIADTLVDAGIGIIKDVKEIKGVGHRVVHGGEGFDRSVILTDEIIKKIEEYQTLAPLHNPHNLSGIRASIKFFPDSLQVAAFDTAFHTTIPPVAYLYAIPYEFYEKYRIRRYGFHGTSHRYVARRAAELMGKGKYDVNVITCHLGNGCSITAVRNGRSVDTSMGLTPLEGLVMGTRSGDIDPGVIFHLIESLGLSSKEVQDILNKKSGLLGISGVSNDFRNLLEKMEEDRVLLAIDIYSYRIKKYIGAYMAVLGRVDAIIFTGGAGEKTPQVRERALSGLENFGIVLDNEKNYKNFAKEEEISRPDSKVKVFVIPTNEELRIAFDTYQMVIQK
ncbi:MAG: acetate kinase [Candidatus Omnitrophica bacterium]|nr:acetate kinase [Candidatus Omnitrophota bacterium]MCM8777591.1 acetate kinase [Candidatus Omnitrophota bacterium]